MSFVFCIRIDNYHENMKYIRVERPSTSRKRNVWKFQTMEQGGRGVGVEKSIIFLTSQKWLEIIEFVHTCSSVKIGFRVQSSSQLNTCLCFWKEPKWIPFIAIRFFFHFLWFFLDISLTYSTNREQGFSQRERLSRHKAQTCSCSVRHVVLRERGTGGCYQHPPGSHCSGNDSHHHNVHPCLAGKIMSLGKVFRESGCERIF